MLVLGFEYTVIPWQSTKLVFNMISDDFYGSKLHNMFYDK